MEAGSPSWGKSRNFQRFVGGSEASSQADTFRVRVGYSLNGTAQSISNDEFYICIKKSSTKPDSDADNLIFEKKITIPSAPTTDYYIEILPTEANVVGKFYYDIRHKLSSTGEVRTVSWGMLDQLQATNRVLSSNG